MILGRADYQRLWNGTVIRSPEVYVRVLKRNQRPGSTTGRFGKIDKRFVVEKISIRRSPQGSECTISTPFQAVNSVNYNEYLNEYLGAIFTVESRFKMSNNNFTVGKILFQGCLTSIQRSAAAPHDNSVTFVLSDLHYRLADNCVKMPTANMTVGQVLAALDGGIYYRERFDWESNRFVTESYFFYPRLWPEDAQGTRIIGMDKSLHFILNRADGIKLNGQTLAQALVDLVGVRKEYIPTIVYNTAYTGPSATFTSLKRGHKKFDLVIGTVGVSDPTPVIPNDISKLNGSISLENVANRIVSLGDISKKATTYELQPAWDRSLDEEFLANRTIRYTPKYHSVGRQWYIPNPVLPLGAKPITVFPDYTVAGANVNHPSIMYRLSDEGEWKKLNVRFTISNPKRRGKRLEINDYDDAEDDTNPHDGAFRLVLLDDPAVSDEFDITAFQDADKPGFALMASRFLQLQIQILGVEDNGEPLSTSSGTVESVLPFTRTRYYTSNYISPTDHGTTYIYGENDEAIEDTSPPELTRTTASAILLVEARDAARRMSKPVRDDQITLSYIDLFLQLGMEWDNLYDTQMNHLETVGGVYIEQIEYTFGLEHITQISFSQGIRDIFSGAIVSGG